MRPADSWKDYELLDATDGNRLERWGEVARRPGEAGFTWCVLSSVLDSALEAEGYDRQKTLRRMGDEGVLLRGSGKRVTVQRRLKGGMRRYCVCIDNARLEGLLDRGAGQAAGDAPLSSAAEPR